MANLSPYDGDPSDHIAIIGMVGRFPGAKNTDAFWQNLRDGVESITFFSADELSASNIDPTLLNNPKYVGADGVIEDMDLFDAEFFSIPPAEAELMDPQHRLFLECACELMEQADYDSESYEGRVAVYGSANLSTYLIRNIMSNPSLRERATSFQTLITNDKDYVATRVSYKLNLTGPSLSVATLCSSSFVAIHLACQALLNYQCELALAGAAALQASRNETFFYQEDDAAAPTTINRALVTLRAYCDWAKHARLITENPVEELKAIPTSQPVPKSLPAEAVDRSCAVRSEKDERIRRAWWYTGYAEHDR